MSVILVTKVLRVGLDLRPTEEGFKSHFGRGIGRYAAELIRLIPKVELEGVTIVPLSGDKLRGTLFERKLIAALPAGRETVESQVCLPRRLHKAGIDLCHFLSHGDAPAWGAFPNIVTVHDLIPLKFPELYRADNENWRYHLGRYLELGAIKRARGILTVSEVTKRDVVELLGVDPEKIIVTYNAADGRFVTSARSMVERAGERDRARDELSLPKEIPLVLYVGGIDPRKNVEFLLETFREVYDHAEGVKPKLLFVGRHDGDKFYPRIKRKIEELSLEPALIQLGFFPDEQLPTLYKAADLFLFPSLYEGFGLPALEGALCGVPVVAGRNSAMPEVLGEEYPNLLPDGDRSAWVRRIIALLRSEELRFETAQSALRHVPRFSWQRTAEQTVQAYLKFGAR